MALEDELYILANIWTFLIHKTVKGRQSLLKWLCRYEGGDAFSRSLLRLSIFLTFICCNSPSISQHDFKINEPLKMIMKFLFVTRISLDRTTRSVQGKFNCIFCWPQSWIFLVWGCLKSSILLSAPSTKMPLLPKPSGLTSIVYYSQGIRHAPCAP